MFRRFQHVESLTFPTLHCNPVQGRTGGVQGACREPPILKTGSLQCEQDSVMRAGFPCENVDTGNTCFYYRDRVCSEHFVKTQWRNGKT